MSVAPASITQDGSALGRWAGEACCSSKDTASRINSPRNSKSSGTPHVSPEPKSQLCIGPEFDMEEAISSQSGQDEEAQTTMGGTSPVPTGLDKSSGDEQQLRHAAGAASPMHAESSGCATHNNSEPDASSNSQRNRGAVFDDEDSSAERQSVLPRALPRSMHALDTPAMDSERSRQSIYTPILSIDSSREGGEPQAAKTRSTKRQKFSHKASAADRQTRASPTPEEERCLARLKPVKDEACELASKQQDQLNKSAVLLQEPVLDVAAEESMSRACSTPPAINAFLQGKAAQASLRAKPEGSAANECLDQEEPVPGRRQKTAKNSRKSATTASTKRSSRAANAQASEVRASEDEDYLPPGDGGEHEQASSKKPRLRIRASHLSSCKADALPPVPPTASSRQPARVRWGAGCGQAAPPVGSPTGYRRLRSQPIDLTELRPDAFAYGPPLKRSKNCALQQAVSNLQQLSESQSTPLMRSASSGIRKPQPYWQSALDQDLMRCTESSLSQMRLRQAADSKLMDRAELPAAMDTLALGARLGMCPLGKAMTRLGPKEEAIKYADDQLLSSCKQLFPAFMSATLSAWDRKLESSCLNLFGETASCILARQQRDAQNAWDDLLARHSIESATLESCQESLHHLKQGNFESMLDSC